MQDRSAQVPEQIDAVGRTIPQQGSPVSPSFELITLNV